MEEDLKQATLLRVVGMGAHKEIPCIEAIIVLSTDSGSAEKRVRIFGWQQDPEIPEKLYAHLGYDSTRVHGKRRVLWSALLIRDDAERERFLAFARSHKRGKHLFLVLPHGIWNRLDPYQMHDLNKLRCGYMSHRLRKAHPDRVQTLMQHKLL